MGDLLSSMPFAASATSTRTTTGTQINSTQHPAGGRPMIIQRHRVQASEERDDSQYSFMQVRKGSVLVTRMESITTYKNQHGQHKFGTQEQSDNPVSANDMCALDEWPSHARRNHGQLHNETDGQKKKGRGVLKGIKASKKRYEDRWALEDTPETDEKVLKIAKERYRGWRSTLSSTYKAYKTDAARLANLPEDLQREEWEWMIEYFGTDSKFQEISQKNSDNRKKQKTKHRVGSKSYSQLSFEKRNLETGEEPDCIALWELTHKKNGTWTNKESQDVYDKEFKGVQNKENETEGPVSSEQKSNIFQTAYKDTLKCKSSQPRGYGYMAKPPSGSERIRSQLEDQARAQAETQKVNSELSHQVTELQDQLQSEREITQERINFERAERENLEERLKEECAERVKLLEEERAERDRLLEEERKSRLEFEKNMIAKFAQLSQQMVTKQVQAHETPKKTIGKENSNPNLQNIVKTASTTGALGTRQNVISPNALIQAATKNNRMFRAMGTSK